MKMIARVIEVGRVKEDRHQQDFVQHEEGICRCICTGHHASTPHLLKTMVSEPISVAMRGRNPDNPSERGKSNGNYKQRLEMNKSGVVNTITSVQKDSMVIEPRVEQVRGHEEMRCRIRKLTPRECFRLMGVDDKDIDTIQAAWYKQLAAIQDGWQ